MWRLAEDTTPGEWYIPAEDANHARHFVIRVKPDNDPKLNQLGFFLVADVYGRTDEEALANARFIIAAAAQYRTWSSTRQHDIAKKEYEQAQREQKHEEQRALARREQASADGEIW